MIFASRKAYESWMKKVVIVAPWGERLWSIEDATIRYFAAVEGDEWSRRESYE